MFAIFTSVCMFSSHIEFLLKRTGIWVSVGAPVAIWSDPAHPLPHGFSVFAHKIKVRKKLGNAYCFKIHIEGEVLECLLGASGCSFFGS